MIELILNWESVGKFFWMIELIQSWESPVGRQIHRLKAEGVQWDGRQRPEGLILSRYLTYSLRLRLHVVQGKMMVHMI